MKGFKGGYKIVSLQLNDITSDFTLSGIYNDIKESHDKPILVSEIVVNGEKMNDAYTIVKKDDTDFIIEVYGYALTVASDDSVTVAEISQGVTSIGGVKGDITLGEGLAITEEGELSASGGGGKVYTHYITFIKNDGSLIFLSFGSSSNTAYTTLKEVVTKIESSTPVVGTGSNPYIMATGKNGPSSIIQGLRPYSDTQFRAYGMKSDYSWDVVTLNYTDFSIQDYKILEM